MTLGILFQHFHSGKIYCLMFSSVPNRVEKVVFRSVLLPVNPMKVKFYQKQAVRYLVDHETPASAMKAPVLKVEIGKWGHGHR